MNNNKGYLLIMALSFIGVLAISAASIFFMVGSESFMARRQVEMTKAFYAAEGGSERMWAHINSNPDTATYQTFNGNFGGYNYNATTGNLYDYPAGHPFNGDPTRMLIEVASNGGIVGGLSRDVVVEYEVENVSMGNTSLLTISDDINLQGHKKDIRILWFTITITAGIDLDGPVASAGTITIGDPASAVNIQGQTIEGVGVPTPQFMAGFDANRDSDELTDPNGDGRIDYAEIPVDPDTGLPYPDQEAIFVADDVNGDNIVSEEDGFTHYYTKELNYLDGGDLGLDPDAALHPYYYSGDQTFGPGGAFDSVPADTNIVFVDGNVDILFNPDSWGGGARDITVVSTGDITIIEPCNGDDDRLTLITHSNVATGGINIEFINIIDSNLNVYSHGEFDAVYGGDTEGTIISNGQADIDTKEASLFYAREIGNNDNIVQDPPVGLPPMNSTDHGDLFVQNVCQIPLNFQVLPSPFSWRTEQ